MKVIVTEDRVEIYREGMSVQDSPGDSCREFAQWMMAWATMRLAEEIRAGIKQPGTQRSVLCD